MKKYILTTIALCISLAAYTTTFAAGTDDFVTVWKTTTANETITIPTAPVSFFGLVYNYNIDCGVNAELTTRVQAGLTGNATCTYPAAADDHEIRISGTFPAIYLDQTGDKNKIIDIKQWGTGQWKLFQNAFDGASSLMTVSATDAPTFSPLQANVSMQNMFRIATSLGDLNVTNWNTSAVSDMTSVFLGAGTANPDVSGWDVSAVTRATGMFSNSGLSNTNYDKLLAAWSRQNLQSNVTLGISGRTYCNTAARAVMTAKGWTFDSDSLSATCPTNNAPTATTLPVTVVVNLGENSDFDLSDVAFADIEDDILTLNLSASAGIFTATGNSNVTVIGSGTAALELSGTSANINTYLDTASAIQYNSVEESVVTVRLRDARTAVELDGISVTQPSLSASGLPNNTLVIPGKTKAFNLSTVILYTPNPDAVTLTLSATAGTWTAPSTGGVVATASASTLSLAGTLSAINTYLQNNTPLIQYNTSISSTVTVTVNDGVGNATLGNIIIGVFTNTDAFVTTWKTTTLNESITIPTTGSGYNYNVDCDFDGTDDLTAQTGNARCVYATPGHHIVSITGDFPAIYFNNTGDKNKIIDINQWGTGQWSSFLNAFLGASNLRTTATDAPDLSATTVAQSMFENASRVNPNTTDWDTSNVIFMRSMFYNAYAANPDVSRWDTSSVTNMANMFRNTRSATPDVSGWDTSKVAYMNEMFAGSIFTGSSLPNPDVSRWNVSAVINADSMMSYSGLTTANYDKLLTSWSQQTVKSGTRFGAAGVKYCNAVARDILTDAPNNWRINDGGAEDPEVCAALAANLDVDGDENVRASTDGILIARYIASVRGASLIAGAVSGSASEDRNEASEIEAYLEMLIPADPADKPLDIDGDGDVRASTDGILIARYIASVRGASLIAGAVSGSASRTTSDDIEAYLLTLDIMP